jgi:DNA end-binding protein Ku
LTPAAVGNANTEVVVVARSIWSGVISFGLVSVPVKLYSATREHDVSFHQFESGTADRIRYQRVNERTGEEVPYERIVRGAEVGAGKYVMLDQDELDSVAPGRSRSVEIHAFVDLAEIDPVYFQKTYYLGPGSEETAKTYALLRDAMAKANRAAIGTLVMRGREYLAAIRADGDVLALETMYFADEIRDPDQDLDRMPARATPSPQELRTAGQLIDSMTGPWKPDEYRDTYTDRVNELIQAKKRGKEIAVAEEAPEATNVTDLMEVLRRSVESAQQRRGGRAKSTSSKQTAAAKQTPAKKTAAAKKPAATTTKPAAAAKKPAAAKKAPAGKATTKAASRTVAHRKAATATRKASRRKAA